MFRTGLDWMREKGFLLMFVNGIHERNASRPSKTLTWPSRGGRYFGSNVQPSRTWRVHAASTANSTAIEVVSKRTMKLSKIDALTIKMGAANREVREGPHIHRLPLPVVTRHSASHMSYMRARLVEPEVLWSGR